ncbi:cold shock domain-containing protein [Herbidospora sp. NEAU-GS84]|uniref:Cold shock domain-containing protein n=1 Tax=Herbidospora solisilvae TaxID=2696284 RepID=A0A7C9JG59_9ACTN|nr:MULTISPECIES: cold-shock protein [Herbidospora]NAS26464.1 cold shock domain-containing protein [Herbidospora solisilvae]GLX98609.1 cold-shock protein [Herbidospora sp. NBRC 101105]
MPSGKVKWYDETKGFGFLTRDDGGEVFVHSSALPKGVEALKPGQKVEFGVAEGRRGQQALSVRVLEQPPTLAKAPRPKGKRKKPDEMVVIVEDLIKLLDELSTSSYQKGKLPEPAHAKKVATVIRAIADDIDA